MIIATKEIYLILLLFMEALSHVRGMAAGYLFTLIQPQNSFFVGIGAVPIAVICELFH